MENKTKFIFPARHFVSFLLMAVLLVLMAMEGRLLVRALLVVPILVLYLASLILFARDYDKLNMAQWKKKEERLRNEIAEK